MVCLSETYGGRRVNDWFFENFVGSVRQRVGAWFEPASLGDLAWILERAQAEGHSVRAMGSRWSLEDVAFSPDWVIDINRLRSPLRYLLEGRGAEALRVRHAHAPKLFHVEAGIRVYDLNVALQDAGLAMPTLGGAQGQTLAGAISTGTHGSDFKQAPLADLVQAVHLVTTGGREVWIESGSEPLTNDDEILRSVLPCADTEIIRDDEILNAVRVGLGRFGVIYSYVLRVVDTYRLGEHGLQLPWPAVEAALEESLGEDPAEHPFLAVEHLMGSAPRDIIGFHPGGLQYLDITFNARNGDSCWVRRRWPVEPDAHRDVRGVHTSSNPMCFPGVANAVLLGAAAILHGYASLVWGIPFVGLIKSPEIHARAAELEHRALDPHMTAGVALALAVNALWASQLFHELDWAVKELNQLVIGTGLGDSLAGRRDVNWKITSGAEESAFDDDCYRGHSVEFIFGTSDRTYLDFINRVLSESGNYLHVGYISVRFSRRSAATLSMHNLPSPMGVAIEITCLRGLSDAVRWMSRLKSIAREMGGRPHWGQENDLTRADVERLYGLDAVERWRAAVERIAGGNSYGFSNDYTRRRGLEPTRVRMVTATRKHGGRVTHLGNPLAPWSPVTVEDAIAHINGGVHEYFVMATTDARLLRRVEVRRYIATAADDSPDNNLSELPDSARRFSPAGLPPAERTELAVTSVIRDYRRIRGREYPGRLRHVCNDSEGWAVPVLLAFAQIRQRTHNYFVAAADGTRTPIVAHEHLSTDPDGWAVNNLDALPDL